MKRCSKMPLWKALPLVFISAILLISITGCTSNTATPTPTPATTESSTDVAKLLTAKYQGDNYTVVTAFSRQANGSYKGVVKQSNRTTPTNVTFVKYSSQADAESRVPSLASNFKAKGWVADSETKGGAVVSKTGARSAQGTACRDVVYITAENIGSSTWGVITETTKYCDQPSASKATPSSQQKKQSQASPTPTSASDVGPLIGSKNSNVYHYPSCSYVSRIKPENRVTFPTAAAAQAAGYHPCSVCHPP